MRRRQRTLKPFPVDLKLVVIAGLSTLLLALWLQQPSDAEPATWDQGSAPTAPTTAAPAPGPVHVSTLDVLGKVSIAVLLIYGAGYAFSRYRNWRPPTATRRRPWRPGETGRLQLRETFVLPRREGTLYLLELDGQSLLVSATAGHVEVVYSPAAPDATSSFEPLPEPATEKPSGFAAVYQTPEALRPEQAFTRPRRGESEWAEERSQLISALMRAE
jgi:hypothetical protein